MNAYIVVMEQLCSNCNTLEGVSVSEGGKRAKMFCVYIRVPACCQRILVNAPVAATRCLVHMPRVPSPVYSHGPSSRHRQEVYQ